MIKALIFDYNQVIVNDWQVHIKAYEISLARYGVKVDKKELKKIMPMSMGGKVKYLSQKYGLQKEEKKIFRQKQKEYRKMAKSKNILFPGAEKALEKLAKKYALGIFTSTTIKQVVLAKKIKKMFKALVSYEDITKQKPNPEGILKCIKKLEAKPEESAYIGDATTDMLAAHNAGCKAIGITTGASSAEELRKAGADIVIGRLNELDGMEL